VSPTNAGFASQYGGLAAGLSWFLLTKGEIMTPIESTVEVLDQPGPAFTLSEEQLAAVAFLARYSGRTLEAYRHDLRCLFQWAADHGLAVLGASRAHLELYRASMEERGLAASTIDRRLSTACGFYRFAHIDGRILSNPAQYVRRPQVHPSERRGLDRGELARFLYTAERFDHAHAALAALLGLNGLRVRRPARPTSRTWAWSAATGCCASSARATSPP
jgi:integrase